MRVNILPRTRSVACAEPGYALYEVMIALSILGLVAIGIFHAFKAGTSVWTTSQQFVAEQRNARALVNTMARSVRMIGYQYSGGSTTVISAASTDLSFYGDLDGDGTIECYRFYLNGTTVYEAVTQGSGCASSIVTATGQPITAAQESRSLRVTGLSFSYYDAADQGGALLSAPLSSSDRALVRRIDIATTIQGANSITPFTIDTQAVVRAGR
jgi:Tfp pilus assembly protein PilW